MRALLAKYVGGAHLSSRLLDLRRFALFVSLVFIEVFVATALFDFYLPPDFPTWKNPVVYTNALGKVALVAALLFCIVAWPRRQGIEAQYTAAADTV